VERAPDGKGSRVPTPTPGLTLRPGFLYLEVHGEWLLDREHLIRLVLDFHFVYYDLSPSAFRL
jgi:hypothetical protein